MHLPRGAACFSQGQAQCGCLLLAVPPSDRRWSRFTLVCRAASNRARRKAQRPGSFEVKVVTPPPQSLGIHALPPDTHNGDQIEVDGKDFVVSSLVLQWKIVGGRYQRDHNRLEVQEMSRYFLNLHLDSLYTESAER